MGRRTFSYRGFRLQLDMPESLGRLWSRRRTAGPDAASSTGSMVPIDLPRVTVERRDPQRALDFLRDPSLAGDGRQASPALQRYLDDAEDKRKKAATLADLVAAYPWYHTIELPGGVTTPGNHDLRDVVDVVGLPARLDGLRALDVATYDGFWAFELERRGAEVTAVDLPSVSGLDWPTGGADIVRAEGLDLPFGEAFNVAADALGSSVKRVGCSVYDLDPTSFGEFDLVMVGDLLLHLERPLAALRAIRSVTRGTLVLMDRFDPTISGDGQRLFRYMGGWQGLEWWGPSLDALVQLVVDAGFADADVRGGLRVRNTSAEGSGWDRAVIHARATAPESSAA